MAKKTMVELTNDKLGVTKKYEISHAERILRMPNNGGWYLPEKSNYKFDEEDGIELKANKGGDIVAEKQNGDQPR